MAGGRNEEQHHHVVHGQILPQKTRAKGQWSRVDGLLYQNWQQHDRKFALCLAHRKLSVSCPTRRVRAALSGNLRFGRPRPPQQAFGEISNADVATCNISVSDCWDGEKYTRSRGAPFNFWQCTPAEVHVFSTLQNCWKIPTLSLKWETLVGKMSRIIHGNYQLEKLGRRC